MILNVLIIALVAGVTYFHYAQGFFSATLSAICAVCAAVLAVSYHEPLVTTLLQGKMADYANSMCLILLFALIYIILRVLLDKAVPGNLRLPLIVDRVGGAVMGLFAGLFTAGVVALAAQAMPFGPSIGGFVRYDVEDRLEVNLPANQTSRGRTRTGNIYEQLTEDTFLAEKQHGLMIPVDEMLLGLVQKLSDNGSLAGDRTLYSVHPNYPDELFAQRLGIQIGASRTALNLPGKTAQVTVPEPGVFRIDGDLNKTKVDAELKELHQRPVEVTRGASDMQLVVRVMFNKDAADSDGMVRLSPASIRLVGGGRNFYPVGTFENGKLFANKLDDFLLINVKAEDRGADFVFIIDEPDLIATGSPKDAEQKIKDGVFIEVKRLARVDLSGRDVIPGVKPSKSKLIVERKPELMKNLPKSGGATSAEPSAGAPAAAVPFVYASITPNKILFAPVNVGSGDADIKNGQIEGGTFTLQSRQFAMLNIEPVRSLQMMAGQADYAVSELFEPAGQKLVQIVGTPPPEGGDQWAFGTLRDWSVADAAGKSYSPSGVVAKVKASNADRMAASFNITGSPKDLTSAEGTPTEVQFIFAIPSGTHLKQFKYKGNVAAEVDLLVP